MIAMRATSWRYRTQCVDQRAARYGRDSQRVPTHFDADCLLSNDSSSLRYVANRCENSRASHDRCEWWRAPV